MVALVALLACSGEPLDSGSEADADADVDADTDIDGYGYSALEGELRYASTYDHAVVCDALVELAGAPYAGECPGCDYAFEVTGEVTEDEGSDDCELDPLLSWVETDEIVDLWIAHSPNYPGYYGDYVDALLVGYTSRYAEVLYPGVPVVLAYAGEDSPGTYARTGLDIAWTWRMEDNRYDLSYFDACDADPVQAGSQEPAGNTAAAEDLDCAGDLADVWEIEVLDEAFTVSVDTNSAETTFDPGFHLNDAEGCTLAFADDNFECTFPPANHGCPAVRVEPPAPSTHQVVVKSWGGCAGERAEYTLSVDGGAASLVEDDVAAWLLVSSQEVEIAGEAELVRD